MNFELRQLRYFVAVAEELHFGRAAARLHMTQPPLSQTIQALEAALGTPLFARTNRSVALTPAGLAMLPEARRLLQQAAALPALAQRAAAGETGRLSLAFVSTVDYSVLPPFLRQFRDAYPQVQIELREATSDVQQADLLEDRIDAGLLISPLSDKSSAVLDYMPVLAEPLIAALPQGTRAARGKAPLKLEQVRDLPLIIFPRQIAPGLHRWIGFCGHGNRTCATIRVESEASRRRIQGPGGQGANRRDRAGLAPRQPLTGLAGVSGTIAKDSVNASTTSEFRPDCVHSAPWELFLADPLVRHHVPDRLRPIPADRQIAPAPTAYRGGRLEG
jgi:DNA-binding transcriptional LysR family regulator